MALAPILTDAGKALLPLALAALTGLLAKGAQYAAHAVTGIRNQQVRQGLDWALAQAEKVAQDVVMALNQTVVNPAKAAGQWDATLASKIKQQALATITTTLATDAHAILAKALPDLPQYLASLVERFVAVAPNKTQAPPKAPSAS